MQVTPEERSLAAAMRWQDELTSRGCLPRPPNRAGTPLLSLANFDPSQLALLQRSDSKLLSAAASAAAATAASAAASPAVQARSAVPTGSLPETEQAAALDAANTSSQDHATFQDQHGTPLKIVQTGKALSRTAGDARRVIDDTQLGADDVADLVQQSPGKAAAASSDTIQRQSAHGTAQLARLPSAKGHCLMSYPNIRPQSPMKHPPTPGERLTGLQASYMLSVRPFGTQSQRPSSAAADTNAVTEQADAPGFPPAVVSATQSGYDDMSETIARRSVVQERSSQPSATTPQPFPQNDSKPLSAAEPAQAASVEAVMSGEAGDT